MTEISLKQNGVLRTTFLLFCISLLSPIRGQNMYNPWRIEPKSGVLGVPVAPAYSKQLKPDYIDCVNTSECFKGSCCVLGRQRFSVPKCSIYGGPGDWCYPDGVPTERNLTYPDGITVHFTAVYDLLCPCQEGLVCNELSHRCSIPDSFHDGNDIDEQYIRFSNNFD